MIGATGAQGGGLARAILADPSGQFAVRAVTRAPHSKKAQQLASLGAEVVQADSDDVRSVERAFAGAYGAFCMTNFWEHFSPETELQQARNLARAAKRAGVGHVIWSTMEDSRKHVPPDDPRIPTLRGRYKVPHWDGKGEADQFFRDLGLPVTFLLTSFCWETFVELGMCPRADRHGQLWIALPLGRARLPGIAVEDIGRCALGIFQQGPAAMRQTIGVAGEHLTGPQLAAAFQRTLGRHVIYEPIGFDRYRSLGFRGAEELGNMFQFQHDFEWPYCGARPPEVARALNPALATFDQWLAANKFGFHLNRSKGVD